MIMTNRILALLTIAIAVTFLKILSGCAPTTRANCESDADQLDTDVSNTEEQSEETLEDENTQVEPELLPPINLESETENARAFLLTRGSMDPEDEVIFYWKGEIFLISPPEPTVSPSSDFRAPDFFFEGFNIGRFVPTSGGTRMITREITVYKNSAGRIINCWFSPWSGETLRVMHVANDPVNFTIGSADYDRMLDRVVFKVNVSLDYPSPLPMDQYPDYSTGNTYQSTELFNFYVSEMDLRDPNAVTVPVDISWSRVGQPLPWMQIDPSEGVNMVYHSRGRKMLEGFEGLPEDLKLFVRDNFPEYEHPPASDLSPNETSWKRFKRLVDEGSYQPQCD